MKLSLDQVKKVSILANLPTTKEEERLYSKQLSKILDYIDQLNKVDTSKIKPTYNVSGLTTVMRSDIPDECELSSEEALMNGVNKRGFFVTKGVFDND